MTSPFESGADSTVAFWSSVTMFTVSPARTVLGGMVLSSFFIVSFSFTAVSVALSVSRAACMTLSAALLSISFMERISTISFSISRFVSATMRFASSFALA